MLSLNRENPSFQIQQTVQMCVTIFNAEIFERITRSQNKA
jgi:hypothetical protein